MACKRAQAAVLTQAAVVDKTLEGNDLLFGVDSSIQANDLLQNNISMFEWVKRNKSYPDFWGRNLTGENCLTKEEIVFLHGKGCKIAPMYSNSNSKITEDEGKKHGLYIASVALELGIPENTAIFLEIGDTEKATTAYLKGFAGALLEQGYTPAFKANTDSKYDFDREFSRGMLNHKDIFKFCIVWAVAPTVPRFIGIATTHVIHPENWLPFAPSGITRDDIAIWQYGRNSHLINDDKGVQTTFNLNLVKNDRIIVEKLF